MNHPRRINWPKYLVDYRRIHDLTQHQLADNLGISGRTVEGWEQGITRPPAYLRLALELLAQKIARRLAS